MKKTFSFNPASPTYYGIGANHDFAGCLVQNGKIVRAIEAERLNRIKHGYEGFNTFNTVSKYLFDEDHNEIHSIATCDTLNTRNISEYVGHVDFYNHHLCHAASVFFTSPYEQSAILVADGIGSRKQDEEGNYLFETVSMYIGEGSKIREVKKIEGKVGSEYDERHTHKLDIPNSLGIFYTYLTKIVGFNFLEDGKTMGLSSYGDSARFYKELSKYVVYTDGIASLSFSEEDYKNYQTLFSGLSEEESFRTRADFAASGQKVLEEMLLFYVDVLYEETKMENLCLSGGVALNSVANGRILRESKFKNIFLFPSCGDSSIAVGAAMLSYYKDNSERVIIADQTPFLGKAYEDEEVLQSIIEHPEISYTKSDSIFKETAELLAKGEVVAWFQGGAEFGPRALGHRSILSAPDKEETKDYINKIIKKRESFRPFAPAVLYDHQEEYFESHSYNPYMLFVYTVKEGRAEKLKAVTHVDNTARVQSVDRSNEVFFSLISEYCELTGIPVLLNTSFNTIQGEPIVETPKDALRSFVSSELKYLAIGNYLCFKEDK